MIDLPDLSNAMVGEEVNFEAELLTAAQNYPGLEAIFDRLADDTRPVNIPTHTLQIGGQAVQDKMEKYLSTKDHLSSGNFKAVLKTPMHFFYERDEGWKEELEKHRKNQDQFDLGTFLHEAILEPTKFSRVVVEPKHSKAETKGVEALIDFWEKQLTKENGPTMANTIIRACEKEVGDCSKISGKKALYNLLKQQSEFQCIKEEHKLIVDTLHKNYRDYAGGILPRLFHHSKREISLYATDPETGLQVRIRPDAMQFAENIGLDCILSVKSSAVDNIDQFLNRSARLEYELSEGMYQQVASQVTGRPFQTTLMIVFQTVAPYGVALLHWDPYDIEVGKKKYRLALSEARKAMDNNDYPGFEIMADNMHGIIPMKQPHWNTKALEKAV